MLQFRVSMGFMYKSLHGCANMDASITSVGTYIINQMVRTY